MKSSGDPQLIVVGGGLAGCEAAWQAAESGIEVCLFEMRPGISTGAHRTSCLAELVCSNSLGSNSVDRASGLLKQELRCYNSLLVRIAEETSLPAGQSLSVDRQLFAEKVTEVIQNHPRINLVREEITSIPNHPVIIASGPLTSNSFSMAIQEFTGLEHLFFFDAIAPVIEATSINMDVAYSANRYHIQEQEPGDYLNLPFTLDEFTFFYQALLNAETVPLRDFELPIRKGVRAGFGFFFEACLPVEELARRGPQSLTFGPMRPVGLRDPRTGRGCYAVIQLRQENKAANQYNMVGFQTNLTIQEQKRVFRLIPGLENAQFSRFGQMHRNTFLAAPGVLLPTLQSKVRSDLFFAGQLAGVEGYMGNIATGLMAGLNAARLLQGYAPLPLPEDTMLGAICHTITQTSLESFQPVKANFGLLSVFSQSPVSRRERYLLYANRSRESLSTFLQQHPDWLPHPCDPAFLETWK